MSVGEAAPAVSSQTRAGRRWPVRPRIVAGVVALVVLAAVAAAAWFVLLRHTAAIDKLVPQSADVLVVADLDPSISQKVNLLTLSHKFPNLKTDQAVNRRVDDALNQAFKDSGLSFDRDIKPWLGSKRAVSASVGDRTAGLLLVDSKDDARAKTALLKLRNSTSGKALHWSDKTYQEQAVSVGSPADGSQPTVYAYVDHTVLIGNDEATVHRAIDADRGATERLAESSGYKATLSLLPGDRLLLLYVDGGRIDQRLKEAIRQGTSGGQIPPASLNQIDAFRSLGFAVAAHSNGLAADLQLRLDPAKLEATTRTALGQHTNGGKVRTRNYGGFDVQTVDAPELTQSGYAPSWAVSGKLGIIGTTPDQVFAVINAQNGIPANRQYATAIREVDQDPDSVLYVAIKDAAAALRGQLPPDVRAGYDKDVAPNLQPLRAFILTSKQQPDRLSERFFLEMQ